MAPFLAFVGLALRLMAGWEPMISCLVRPMMIFILIWPMVAYWSCVAERSWLAPDGLCARVRALIASHWTGV